MPTDKGVLLVSLPGGPVGGSNSSPETTFPTEPAENGPTCKACGLTNAAGADRCAGASCQKTLKGNRLAKTNGLYEQVPADYLSARRAAFFAASVADDGGESEVSTRRRSLHAYRARLDTTISQLADAIERFGLFDRRGRLRASWLQRLEGLIDRARALDVALGLNRHSKPVESATDIIAEYKRTEGGNE